MTDVPEIATHAVAAVGAGGGVLWLARTLFKRMIDQYDARHRAHDEKEKEVATALEAHAKELSGAMAEAFTRVAVLEATLEDARRLRVELQALVSQLRGELEAKHGATVDEVDALRVDIWIAHERVRMLARGDSDFSKIEPPKRIARR